MIMKQSGYGFLSCCRHFLFLLLAAGMAFLPATPASAMTRKAIPAKAAVVMDSSGALLFAKFPHAKLAPASTVKLVTAMVAIDHLDPSQKVNISTNASRIRSIEPRICPDEEMTVSDLLHLALMKSINSAAVALAEAVAGDERAFAAMMNRKAQEIGARETLFANASGLPQGKQYTTASDLARILQAALGYPLIREILGKRVHVVRTAAGRELAVESSNDLLWQDQNMIGGKTGYTGNARHCFVAAINSDRGTLYTAVMGARSRRSLWKSTLLLAEMGMAAEMQASHEAYPLTRMATEAAGGAVVLR